MNSTKTEVDGVFHRIILSRLNNNDNVEITEEFIKDYVYQFYNVVFEPFQIKDFQNVYDFVYKNDDLIDLLRNIKPIVRNYFPNEELVLEYVPDPEIDLNQLVLFIKTFNYKDNAEIVENKLDKLDSEIFPLLNDNTRNKFLIEVE